MKEYDFLPLKKWFDFITKNVEYICIFKEDKCYCIKIRFSHLWIDDPNEEKFENFFHAYNVATARYGVDTCALAF